MDVPQFTTEKIEFNSKEKIFSAMVVFGFLCYHGNIFSIPNRELKIKFLDALKYEASNTEDEFSRIMQALRICRGKKLAIGIAYNSDNTSKDDNRHHYVKIEEIE